MRLVLERRAERSILIALISPLLAIALTLATGALLFCLLGKPPLQALKVYFPRTAHRPVGAAGRSP
jgi:simple sugar transport system permease protein